MTISATVFLYCQESDEAKREDEEKQAAAATEEEEVKHEDNDWGEYYV